VQKISLLISALLFTLLRVEGTTQGDWPGAKLFQEGAVHEFEITLTPGALQSLRSDPRHFVSADLGVDQVNYTEVALHLKGQVGSFRTIDDKAAFTIDFCKLSKNGHRLDGLRRIHLNNSVEDPSYATQKLASDLFREAGVPAQRVAHALVRLNGKPLGTYLLLEGFTEDFLSCYFQNPGPDLFEPDEGHDLDQPLKRMSVQSAVPSRGNLGELTAAALEKDPGTRWTRLSQLLDVDRFATFMALEVMLCHRDGYTLARNNFRLYYDIPTGKWVFFPQDMDQLLGKPELPWKPRTAGLVATAVLNCPAGAEAYSRTFREVFTDRLDSKLLAQRIDRIIAPLRARVPSGEFAQIRAEAEQVKQRIAARGANLLQQLSAPEPAVLDFVNGPVLLTNWIAFDPPIKGKMELLTRPDGAKWLYILSSDESASVWKTSSRLAPGTYEFQGRLKYAAVKPLPYGRHHGVALRAAGFPRPESNLTGDSDWHAFSFKFEVTETIQEVQLLCELRAGSGEAWFDLSSLKLIECKPALASKNSSAR